MSQVETIQRIYVTCTPGVLGGKPSVAGHRISVEMIAILSKGGYTPDDIVRCYPTLTLANVHGALAFYFDNVDEINASIARSHRVVAAMREKTGPGPLESRVARRELESDAMRGQVEYL